jgi:hypothetical protein
MITKERTEKEKELQRAQEFLCSVFAKQERPTAYTILKSVSASGMSRTMKVVTYDDGRVLDITWWVSLVSSVGTLTEKNGQRVVRVGGCGMDMGFHLVHSLGIALYGLEGGYKISQEWL